MFPSYIFICSLVLYSCGVSHAKECSDCVSIRSCQAALQLAAVKKDEESMQQFKSALCGYENDDPKFCCSDFAAADEIENHPNVELLPKDCGGIEGSRIVGGSVAKLYEFPWMALISYRTRFNQQEFKCGGTVINSKYILTAAHCVEPSLFIAGVRIGELQISSTEDCQGEKWNSVCESHLQDILVEERNTHEEYKGRPFVQNDIALLRLKTPIDFSHKNAGPICLPVPKKLRTLQIGGRNATVAGWGATETESASDLLLKVTVPVTTGKDCDNYSNKNLGPGEDRTDKTFCAGEHQKDSCSGDSGGPMMIEEEYDGVFRMIQYGIVSRGPEICGSMYPGIYTDVTKHMKWILDNLKP